MVPVLPVALKRLYAQHICASYFSGLRCGVIRLVQVIAACSLGAEALDLAWIVLANALGLMCSYFVGTRVTARNSTCLLLVPLVISNLLLVLVLFVNDLHAFIILMCVHMFVDACCLPAMSRVQKQLYPREIQGCVLGSLRQVFMICGIVAAVLVSELMHACDSLAMYVLPAAGVLGLGASLCYWRMCTTLQFISVIPIEVQSLEKIKDPLRDGAFQVFLATVAVAEIAHLLLIPLLPEYVMSYGLGGRGLAWFLVILPGICAGITMKYWGRKIDQWGVVRVRAVAAALYALEPFLLALLPVLPNHALAECCVYLAALCRGCALGAVILSWSIAPLHFSQRENCAAYMGCNTLHTGLRCLMAPMLGVFLINYMPMPLLLLSSALCLLLSALLLLLQSGVGLRAVCAAYLHPRLNAAAGNRYPGTGHTAR